MTIKVGDRIPEATLKTMGAKGPEGIDTATLFGGKKVVLFAVPGAFTPGCSRVHLPGFVQQAQDVTDKGVDRIVCVSVNDAFVMRQVGAAYNRHPAMSLLFSDRLMMMMYSGVSTKDWTPRKPTLPAQLIPETLRRSSSFLTELPFSPAEW